MSDKKICPMYKMALLAYRGYDESKPNSQNSCDGEDCEWWDKLEKMCGQITQGFHARPYEP